MLQNKMEFQIVMVHECLMVKNIAAWLKKLGVYIFDLRESNICENDTDEVVDSCFILRCRVTKHAFESIKTKFTDETIFEGYRTIA